MKRQWRKPTEDDKQRKCRARSPYEKNPFYVEWNDGNKVEFLPSLKDCNVYRVCIVKSSDLQSEYKVTSVPTVIIFNNGVEQSRFNPTIMMQLDATKKQVQSVIDEITFNKFQ